jgi:DNA mismatch endonuclease, patch repair protein
MPDNLTRAQRSFNMSRIRSGGNASTEERFLRLLRTAKVSGWRRNIRLPGRPDLVFRRERVLVFLDGCFWHCCPKCYRPPKSNLEYWGPKLAGNAARDRRVRGQLRAAGWTVVRVWEHEIKHNPRGALSKISRQLLLSRKRKLGSV